MKIMSQEKPSKVLFGLILLKKGLLPKFLPMKYAEVSLNAINTIKNINDEGDNLYII